MNELSQSLTRDDFLGGRVSLVQPVDGFRAGTDTVMMAAAVPARTGDHVLELGCGSGVAMACLSARVSGLEFTGAEVQTSSCETAQQNIDELSLNAKVYNVDVLDLPAEVRQIQFDHVIMNPPFYDVEAHVAPQKFAKARAHIAQDDFQAWIKVGCQRLAPKGTITIIHRASALAKILSSLSNVGDIRILPIAGRQEQNAKSVIVQARGQSAGELILLPRFLTTDGQGNRSLRIQEITRDGNGLSELWI